jgi:hypothetical protein
MLFKKAFAGLLAVAVLAMSAAASPCNLANPSSKCCPCSPAAHAAPQGKCVANHSQMRIRIVAQGREPLLDAAILPDETNSPQSCEGASCNRADAFARSAVTVDSPRLGFAPLVAIGLFILPARHTRPPGPRREAPPTAGGTLDPVSIALRI